MDFDEFMEHLIETVIYLCLVGFLYLMVLGGMFLFNSTRIIKETKSYLQDTYSAEDISLGLKNGSFVADNKYYDIKWTDLQDKAFNIVAKDGTVTKVQLKDTEKED